LEYIPITLTHIKGFQMGLFDQGFASKNGVSPAAMALLGLLAVKGFENRDKLGEAVGGLLGGSGGLGSILGGLGGLLGQGSSGSASNSAGGIVSGGIGNLVESFNKAGHGDVANSWVQNGPNQDAAPHQIEQSLGSDVLDQLASATGLNRDELVRRLGQALPAAVNALTPDGRVPTAQEAGATVGQR
jgi:uncharacterized protein YidB (DUF937 family)